jgi:hypothetical protein
MDFFHRKNFPIYIRYINMFSAREEYTVANSVMSKAQKQSKKYKEVHVLIEHVVYADRCM